MTAAAPSSRDDTLAAERWLRRGLRLHRRQQTEQAVAALERALSYDPQLVDAMLWRGILAYQQAELALAAHWFRQAIGHDPQLAAAHYNLGLTLEQLGQPAAALHCYDATIALQPDHVQAHNNRAILLLELGHAEQALASYDWALALRPDYLEARFNRGVALASLRRWPEAIQTYETVLTLAPAHHGARFALAIAWLTVGDWARGWPQYEARWDYPAVALARLSRQAPEWVGPACAGQHLLVDAEQGFGDTLQFSRFILALRAQGARVTLRAQPTLHRLLADLPVEQVLAPSADVPGCDAQISLMSLPAQLGISTENIPAAEGWLQAPAASVTDWQSWLATHPGPRIGLVWAGNPQHQQDAQRSLDLALLLAALPPGLTYIPLQKQPDSRDVSLMMTTPHLRNLPRALTDFADTAGLCQQLDLLISVDTSVAHLAGALGVPVWLLLAYHADWRWLTDRDDTPWYQQTRLFRQQQAGHWLPVLQQVSAALHARFGTQD